MYRWAIIAWLTTWVAPTAVSQAMRNVRPPRRGSPPYATARPFAMNSMIVRGELATGDPCGRRDLGSKPSSSVPLERQTPFQFGPAWIFAERRFFSFGDRVIAVARLSKRLSWLTISPHHSCRAADRELAFALRRTPPALWALACKTFEYGREVRLSLEADAKCHLCERHIRA